MFLPSYVQALPSLAYGVDEDREENDGCTRRYVQVERQQQTAQTTEVADTDGQTDDALKALREQVGCHLGNGKQRDDQHDAHHAEAGHDGQGDEHHQEIFEQGNGNALGTGKVAVEGDADDGAQEEQEKKAEHDRKHSQQQNVARRNGQDIAEQVGGEVGGIAGGQEGEHDAQGHAQGPEDGDGRVFAHVLAFAEPFHTEGGQYGKHGSRQDGGDACIESQTDAAERGMGQSAADEDQPAGDDVSAHQSAGDAGQQAAQQGVLKEGVLQQLRHVRLLSGYGDWHAVRRR